MDENKKELVLVDFGTLFGTSWFSVTGAEKTTLEEVNHDVLNKVDIWLDDLAKDGELIVCFDSAPYARKAIYDGYKASRAKRPPGFGVTKDAAQAAARAKFSTAEYPGAEADDVIATLAGRPNDGIIDVPVRIVSRDKDLLCLVSEASGVYFHDPGAKDGARFLRTAADVEFKMGVEPKFVPTLLSLAGDAADDIPGAKGLGPKGAIKLIKDFGDVASILKAADSASSPMEAKLRKLVIDSRQSIVLSTSLVQLVNLGDKLTVVPPGNPAPEPDEEDAEKWNEVAEQIHELGLSYRFRRDRTLNIHQRMNLVMEEITHIKKSKQTPKYAGDYKYAGHDQLTELLHGPYTRHGIVRTCSMDSYVVTETCDFEATVLVRWTNVDNQSDFVEVKAIGLAPCTTGADKPKKVASTQSGVAMSYAQKMAEFKAFSIAGDDTPDGEEG